MAPRQSATVIRDFAGALDNSKPEVVAALIAKAANSVSSEVAA
jgi:hypothetical protein